MSYAHTQQMKKVPGGNEPWRTKDRHYCAVCNAWMGSDRHSIGLHENGKKHREAVEADLVRRRDAKAKMEKDQRELESAFAKVNAAVGVTGSAFGSTMAKKKPWGWESMHTYWKRECPCNYGWEARLRTMP